MMKTICMNCGYEQERKSWSKTPQRCTVCRSRKFTVADIMNEVKEETVNDTIDNRRIGTTDDVCMPPLSNPKVKKENRERNKEKRENEERIESWRKNELLHQQGRREQTGMIREAVQFIGSMVSEKNPRGHGSKAINHIFRVAEIKRKIHDEGGDIRLLGENTRKLTGDEDSLFGFRIVRSGKGGILEYFRRRE